MKEIYFYNYMSLEKKQERNEKKKKKIVLGIEGMHCDGCVNRLTKVLKALDGVVDAKVSLENKSTEIEYDENELELDDIKQAVSDAGFEAKE